MKFLIKFFHKMISAIVMMIPRSWQMGFGYFIGWLWFDVIRLRRKVVLENIERAFPGIDKKEKKRIARGSMAVVGQNIFDVFLLPFFSKKWAEPYFDVEGTEKIEKALEENRGVLFLSLHVGSGDLGVSALNYLYDGPVMNLISKEFKTPWLNRFWFYVRGMHGTRFIPPRRSTFEILRALKRNEAVIFVLDQYMGPPLGVKTKFFSIETGTAMGLALIADRTKTPVLPLYTYFKEKGRSQIVVGDPILWRDQGHRDKTISHMTQLYTDKIEEIVREHPDQWLWVHRRWKEFKE